MSKNFRPEAYLVCWTWGVLVWLIGRMLLKNPECNWRRSCWWIGVTWCLIEKVERNMFWIGLYPIRQLKKSINLSGKVKLLTNIENFKSIIWYFVWTSKQGTILQWSLQKQGSIQKNIISNIGKEKEMRILKHLFRVPEVSKNSYENIFIVFG